MLGRVALDDWKVGEFLYLPLKKHAQKGILVSGASGAGKTVAAKVVVEELLEDGIPILVFDYTEQWQRPLEKNTNDEMLDRYVEFGMRRSPKGFKGRVVQSVPRADDLLTSMGGTVIDLSDTYDSEERVGKVAQILDQVLESFQFQKDSEDLRLLIVVEEAHLWTSKDLPKDAVRFLDSAVRSTMKKGVGVMLISQKISDFDQPNLIENMKEVSRVLKHGATFLVVGGEYKGSKRNERNQKWDLIIGMNLHTVEEFEEVLREGGFSDVTVHENYREGWICGVCGKP